MAAIKKAAVSDTAKQIATLAQSLELKLLVLGRINGPVLHAVEANNARVNRADKLCGLVKMKSDTMGACDHPTTAQT